MFFLAGQVFPYKEDTEGTTPFHTLFLSSPKRERTNSSKSTSPFLSTNQESDAGVDSPPLASTPRDNDLLLLAMGNRAQEPPPPPPVTWMSLPHKPQLFILAICRLSEPLSNTCLLPYLYYLVRSLQASSSSPSSPATSPASISRQAGLLVSMFAVSQFATSVPWASAANHFGRKAAIVAGLMMSIAANLGFGFSTSVPWVMFWRIVAGLGNGNIGVLRTMTAEIVTEPRYQSRAFLLLPLVFNSGLVLGLALGGCLADPVDNWPRLFGGEGIFNFGGSEEGVAWMRRWPFALPTIFNAGVLCYSLLFAVCGLKETMPGLEGKKDYGLVVGDAFRRRIRRYILRRQESGYLRLETSDKDQEDEDRRLLQSTDDLESRRCLTLTEILAPPPPSSSTPPISPPRTKLSMFDLAIRTKPILYTVISFAILPLHNSAFMQLFPVFLSTPRSSSSSPPRPDPSSPFLFTGGLGLASPTIGIFLSAFGIFGILIQLCIYPSLQARLGTLGAYKLALAIFPAAYVASPYLAKIPEGNWTAQAVAIAAVLFLQVTARTFGIPSSVILLTNSAPTPLALAAIHGWGNMCSSLARAVGPALGGVVFGWGLEGGCVGLVWWTYLTFVSIAGFAWTLVLKEGGMPSLQRGGSGEEERGWNRELVGLRQSSGSIERAARSESIASRETSIGVERKEIEKKEVNVRGYTTQALAMPSVTEATKTN